jgi:hypothetical protein
MRRASALTGTRSKETAVRWCQTVYQAKNATTNTPIEPRTSVISAIAQLLVSGALASPPPAVCPVCGVAALTEQ